MKGHIRARGRDTWQIFYDLPPDADGKRRQKSETVHGPKRAAQARLRDVLTALDTGRFAAPQKLSVSQVIDDWLESVQVADKTRVRYEEIVRLHLKPAFGGLNLQRLNAAQIEAFHRDKRKGGRGDGREGGLSERTLLHCHRVLDEALKRAVRLKLVSANPCADVDKPRPQGSKAKALTQEQALALLEAARGSRLFAPVLVAVTTGLRLGELLGLSWDDVDLEAGTLEVNKTLQRIKEKGLVLKDRPKTKSSFRTVALSRVTVDALRQHLAVQEQEPAKLQNVWIDNGLVFPNEMGELWGPDSVSHQFSRLAESLGFSITFHGLRQSHASHLLKANIHPKIASGRLGHSSIGITMDLYSHMMSDFQREAVEKIDAAFESVSNSLAE